jgi:hypothetical protein
MLCSQTPSVDVLLRGTARLSVILCNTHNSFHNTAKVCVCCRPVPGANTIWNGSSVICVLWFQSFRISHFLFSAKRFYIPGSRVSCSNVPRVAWVLHLHGTTRCPRLTWRTALQRHKLHISLATRRKVSACLFRVQVWVCPKLVCLSLPIILFQ